MSVSRNDARTLSGVDASEINGINIPSSTSAIIIGGDTGSVRKVVGKSDDNLVAWVDITDTQIEDGEIITRMLNGANNYDTTGFVACATLSTTGDALIGGNMEITGDLEYDGDFLAEDLTFFQSLKGTNGKLGAETFSVNATGDMVCRDIDASTGDVICDSLNVDNAGTSLTTVGDILAGGSITSSLTGLGTNGLNATGNLYVGGNAQVVGDLRTNADFDCDLNATITGLLTTNSNIYNTGTITSTGQIRANLVAGDGLVVEADAHIKGDLQVDGNLDLTGDITQDQIYCRELYAGNPVGALGTNRITIDGDTGSITTTTATADLSVGNDITASGDITATGDVFGVDADFSNDITAGNDIQATNDILALNRITAVENVVAGGNVAGTDALFSGNISAVDITASGDVACVDMVATADLTANNSTILGSETLSHASGYISLTGAGSQIRGATAGHTICKNLDLNDASNSLPIDPAENRRSVKVVDSLSDTYEEITSGTGFQTLFSPHSSITYTSLGTTALYTCSFFYSVAGTTSTPIYMRLRELEKDGVSTDITAPNTSRMIIDDFQPDNHNDKYYFVYQAYITGLVNGSTYIFAPQIADGGVAGADIRIYVGSGGAGSEEVHPPLIQEINPNSNFSRSVML